MLVWFLKPFRGFLAPLELERDHEVLVPRVLIKPKSWYSAFMELLEDLQGFGIL